MRTLRRTQRTRFRQRLRLSTLLNGASFMRCLPRRSAFMRCYSSDAAGAGEKNQLSTVVARGEHAQGRMLRAHVDQRWRKRRKTRREPGRALLHGRARENERVYFRPIKSFQQIKELGIKGLGQIGSPTSTTSVIVPRELHCNRRRKALKLQLRPRNAAVYSAPYTKPHAPQPSTSSLSTSAAILNYKVEG